jgi:hypothetical protein
MIILGKFRKYGNNLQGMVNALDRVLFKLKNVKSFLKGWGFNRTGDHKKKKMEINVKIMILDNLEEVSLLLEEQV